MRAGRNLDPETGGKMVKHHWLCRAALLFGAIFGTLAPDAARSQENAGKREPPPVKVWRVEGRTLNEKGQPLAGIRVFTGALPYLPAGNESETVSDSNGQFQLEIKHRVNGRMIRASRDGDALQAAARMPYEAETASSIEPVTLTLKPARELSFQVTDAQKQPVADATILVTSMFEQCADAKTDQSGQAKLRLPADAPLQYTVALKQGVGLDYWTFRQPNEPKSNPYVLASDHAAPLPFVLNGIRPVTVRVIDEADQPMAGVSVTPWLLRKPNKGEVNDSLNLSGLPGFSQQTNEQGVASFDVIPTDNVRQINFWARADGYFSPERHNFDPASDKSEVVAKLIPLMRIAGRVLTPDGQPAADIEVHAAGDGYSFDSFRGTTRSDTDGRFEFQAYPDHYYQLSAGNREWASPPVNKIVRTGTPVDDLELKLQPATRVFGRVTIGPNSEPIPEQFVSLYQKEAVSYYDLPEDQKLPNPGDSNQAVSPRIIQGAKADKDGRFEFFTGPGEYYIFGPSGIDPPQFTINDEQEVEINLHAQRPLTIATGGRVVLHDDPNEGVSEAVVSGYPFNSRLRDLRAVTGADGRFQAERGTGEMIVYAASKDRTLAGITKIGPEDAEIVIPIGPTGSARGRLTDEETAVPIADRRVEYGIWIQFTDSTFSWRFGGNATTDADGNFTIDKLIPGQEYVLEAVTETDGEGNPRSWRRAGKVTVKSSSTIEQIGELKLPAPYREQTTEERVAKAFSAPKSLDEQLKSRLRDAPLSYQRVLLVVGSAESPLVRQFYAMEYERKHEGVANALLDYLLVPVNTGDSKRVAETFELATRLKFDLPDDDDAAIVVLDETGKTAAQSLCSSLAANGEIEPIKLFEFLNAHRPKLPDAEDLLTAALAQAKSDDKRVFVQISGPRCGWCMILSRYLDDHRVLFDKEFACVKLDGRMDRGRPVIERVRPKRDGGIPWLVIMDAHGQPLITSDAEGGNIGHPSDADGIAHFEKMLRTGVRHLTDADIKSLIDALATQKN
jgi:hypothetical protein